METYTLRDAARILKVSPSRLRHWKRTALVQSRTEPRANDSRPDFDFRDLVCVRAILSMVDSGISVQRIRRAIGVLQENEPDIEDPLAALRVWAEGSERIVVHHDGVLIEPEGQMVLDFVSEERPEPEPANIDDVPRSATDLKIQVLALFEKGCRLDSDPATYEEAMTAYLECLEHDPYFADAHCNLGAVLYNAGNPLPARRSFERCLEIDDCHVEAHFNLANLLEEEGCNEIALSHYRAALRADPFYPELHVNMALLYERLSRSKSSRDHWRRYLQLDPAGSWAEVARQRIGKDESPAN